MATQYAVCHLQKGEKPGGSTSSLTTHIERRTADGKLYIPQNADKRRTMLNRELISFPAGVDNRTAAIAKRIKDAKLIRAVGKNQSTHVCIILSGTHEQMMKLQDEGRLDDWIGANLNWLNDTFGKENVVSCVLHMDEKTPHLHATVVPIVNTPRKRREREGGQKNKVKQGNRLSADEIMARGKLHNYQTTYAEAMKHFGLERGIVGSKAHHVTAMEHMRNEEVDIQTNIERLLNEMTALQNTKDELEDVVASQKKEQKETKAGFKAKVMNVFGAGDLAKANDTIKAKDAEITTWKKKYNGVVKKYNTDKAAWDKDKRALEQNLKSASQLYQDQMNCNTMMGQNLQKALSANNSMKADIGELLSMFTNDSIPQIKEVATALIFGSTPVVIPCSGGGSVSSNDGWDDRKKDEDEYLFRLRCWLHAGKMVRKARSSQRDTGRHR